MALRVLIRSQPSLDHLDFSKHFYEPKLSHHLTIFRRVGVVWWIVGQRDEKQTVFEQVHVFFLILAGVCTTQVLYIELTSGLRTILRSVNFLLCVVSSFSLWYVRESSLVD